MVGGKVIGMLMSDLSVVSSTPLVDHRIDLLSYKTCRRFRNYSVDMC